MMDIPSKRPIFNALALQTRLSSGIFKRTTDEVRSWKFPSDELEYPLTYIFVFCLGFWMNYCARQISKEYHVTFAGTQYDQYNVAKILSTIGTMLILLDICASVIYLKYLAGFRSMIRQGMNRSIRRPMMVYFVLWLIVMVSTIIVGKTLSSGEISVKKDLYSGLGKARSLYQGRLASRKDFGYLCLKYNFDEVIRELTLLIPRKSDSLTKMGLNISCYGAMGNAWTFSAAWPKYHTELIQSPVGNRTETRGFMDSLPLGRCNITACTPCVLYEKNLPVATNHTHQMHASTCFTFIGQHKSQHQLHGVRAEIIFVAFVTIISMLITMSGTLVTLVNY